MDNTITHRSFVSYIDRTREYYSAQGYDRPYAWARHTDAPFTPLPKPIRDCRIGVVTTASPWREQQAVEGVLRGDKSVSSVDASPAPEKVYTDDLAWDKLSTHTDDLPSFLPLEQLAACEREGRIGRAPLRFHCVPTDYSQRRTIESDAPEILSRLREDGADIALLVPL